MLSRIVFILCARGVARFLRSAGGDDNGETQTHDKHHTTTATTTTTRSTRVSTPRVQSVTTGERTARRGYRWARRVGGARRWRYLRLGDVPVHSCHLPAVVAPPPTDDRARATPSARRTILYGPHPRALAFLPSFFPRFSSLLRSFSPVSSRPPARRFSSPTLPSYAFFQHPFRPATALFFLRILALSSTSPALSITPAPIGQSLAPDARRGGALCEPFARVHTDR